MAHLCPYVKAAALDDVETKMPSAAAAAPDDAKTKMPSAAAATASLNILGTVETKGMRSKRRKCLREHCTVKSTLAAPPEGNMDASSELLFAAKILMVMSTDTWDRESYVPIIVEPKVWPSSADRRHKVFRRSPSITRSPPVSRPWSAASVNVPEPTVTPPATASVLGPESFTVLSPSAKSESIMVTAPETLPIPVSSYGVAPVLSQVEDPATVAATPHVPNSIPVPAAAAAPGLSQAPNPYPASHACPICGVVFSSYQARGGHMTKHRKDATGRKIRAARTSAASSTASSKKIHQCEICHKIFKTGQALGGHKRLHYDEAANAANSAPAGASGISATPRTDKGSSSKKRRTPIDANVDPAAMDVDGAESMSFASVPAPTSA